MYLVPLEEVSDEIVKKDVRRFEMSEGCERYSKKHDIGYQKLKEKKCL